MNGLIENDSLLSIKHNILYLDTRILILTISTKKKHFNSPLFALKEKNRYTQCIERNFKIFLIIIFFVLFMNLEKKICIIFTF